MNNSERVTFNVLMAIAQLFAVAVSVASFDHKDMDGDHLFFIIWLGLVIIQAMCNLRGED